MTLEHEAALIIVIITSIVMLGSSFKAFKMAIDEGELWLMVLGFILFFLSILILLPIKS